MSVPQRSEETRSSMNGKQRSNQIGSMIRNIRQMQSELLHENPLQAICLNPMIDAAKEIGRARKAFKQQTRQNQENAKRRALAERQRGRSGLETRLMKDPAGALAEAEATRQGVRHLMEIWSCLGTALLEKDGLNQDEFQLACIMLGAPNLKLRTSKARQLFDRALNEDRNRKFEVIQNYADQFMRIYLERMADETWRNFLEESEMQAAIYGTFLHQYTDWVEYILEQLDEQEEFFKKWRERPPISRNYWKSTRKVVAAQILKYKAMLQSLTDESDAEERTGEWTAQETRKADQSRKFVNTSLANFQKAVNIAKSAGFFTPAKPVKKTKAKAEEDVVDSYEMKDEAICRNPKPSSKSKPTQLTIKTQLKANATPEFLAYGDREHGMHLRDDSSLHDHESNTKPKQLRPARKAGFEPPQMDEKKPLGD